MGIKHLHERPPPLGEIILGIAQLGGYLNRKSDPPPGPKVMWIGMQKMHMMAVAFKMLKEIYKPLWLDLS